MNERQLSFLEISGNNYDKLVEYIARLRKANLKFPEHKGKVNKTAVARACGFARETFQQNLRFASLLQTAVADLGIEVPGAEEPEPRNAAEKASIMRLEQQLASLRSENYELRRRLRRYELIADHMGGTGRRVKQ